MADIIETIKKAALDAMENSSPTSIMYGTVTSVKPLEVQVEQKLLLTSEFLVLTKNVIDYEVEVSINWNTEQQNFNSSHTHNCSVVSNEDISVTIENQNIDLAHSHTITGKKKITIHNGLKQNDKVILLQQQGGQKFIVLDKIY